MLKLVLTAFVLSLPSVGWAETRLLMAEEAGCFWCARWNAEVGDAYDKTAEGKAAPLQRYDIRNGPPEGVTFERRVIFTPTFILVDEGKEIGRLEGYPGEDFFWGLLGQMLERADIELDQTG